MAGRSMSQLTAFAITALQWAGSQGWRSECGIQGVDLEITVHGANPPSDAAGVCRVAFLNHKDFVEPTSDYSTLDVIFTDSRAVVPFAGRRDNIHFLENISEYYVPEDLDGMMTSKTQLLSVLLPLRDSEAWDDVAQAVYDQASELIPDHIYYDDGSLETHKAAFTRYRFCLISNSLSGREVSLPFIRSVAFHTIAVFNGFVEVGAMVFNGIADFVDSPFDLHQTLSTIERHNNHLGALWHYQTILQDQLQYRYNRPFDERLLSQACTLCRHKSLKPNEPPMVFVGIYSARRNFEKRQTVRDTWGRLLKERYGFRYTFFLGEAPTSTTAEERQLRLEVDTYGDIEFLEATEGYRMNSRKGLQFLEWIALRTEAEFLLKVDDDVYFRPAPLLRLLLTKPPTQYIWGYFDYISPVPREEDHNFYNTIEEYPFDVFAPYPRGVVRVLSMDLVRLLAEAGRENKLRTIYGDDPCIGVHLRQLLFDPEEPLPSITLDDFDNKVFAMEPSCHPNLWSRITNRTWVIHHVGPEVIRCMWDIDWRAGYYFETEQGTIDVKEEVAGDEFADLCACAQEQSFEERTDISSLNAETNRILFDEETG
eukprot:TRINITY_DN42570_c0_g2_i1.p1 TRINITY_DN42570_c0_g2~~TRINITY_DN42570_c0_g2_i1.p1  ORF type:complete len:595 (-),score=113.40 TRINITY_DN42570_c0_g2_i1:63-1847(-)